MADPSEPQRRRPGRSVRIAARSVAGLLVGVALLAGCSGGPEVGPTELFPSSVGSVVADDGVADESVAGAAVSERVTPSTAPTEDPFAVPTVIDAAYAQAVNDELERRSAGVTRRLLRAPLDPGGGSLPPAVVDEVTSIFAEPLLSRNLDLRLAILTTQVARDVLAPADEYRRIRYEVEAVLATSPCVLTLGRPDPDPTLAAPRGTAPLQFRYLVRADGANATGWQLAALLDATQGGAPVPEDEVRRTTASDLRDQAPTPCR